jgi:zinc/manganese transport system ATP-binding protein
MHTSTSVTPTEKAAQIYQSNSSPVIAAENLTAGYKNVTVWRNASLALDQGMFVAVIGPNGAGKTTLFRLLLGLQQPLGGTIRVFSARPKRGNSQIGYVPQRHVIDSDTNIESLQLVRLGLAGRKLGLGLFSDKDTKAAIQALEDVGAGALAHRPLGELSGGELQRVFLAEALVSNPGLLLLDEPLSNLDIKRERELLQVVNKVVRSRGVTALLIAHHINPLLPYLDRLVYIANGRVATGKPGEVLTSKSLSALYGVEVEVLHDSKGNIAIVGLEDVQDEHEN